MHEIQPIKKSKFAKALQTKESFSMRKISEIKQEIMLFF